MKGVLVVFLAVIATSFAFDLDKCLNIYQTCYSTMSNRNRTCVKEKKSDKYYYFDNPCSVKSTQCYCDNCLEDAEAEECENNENDDPSDEDTGIDKCIEKYKKCPSKELKTKKVCVKDIATGKYRQLENECSVESTNCLCQKKCVEKVDEKKCKDDNDDGGDGGNSGDDNN